VAVGERKAEGGDDDILLREVAFSALRGGEWGRACRPCRSPQTGPGR